MINRFLIALMLFAKSAIFACALCAAYTPTAHIVLDFKSDDNNIKFLNMNWVFSKNFTKITKENYDLNQDGNLDKKELGLVEKNLLDYLIPRDYLLSLGYYYNDKDQNNILLKSSSHTLRLSGDRLIFDLNLEMNVPIKNGLVVWIDMFDKEDYFKFKFQDDGPFKLGNKFLVPNINQNVAFFKLSDKVDKKLKDILKNPSDYSDLEIDNIDKINYLNKINLNLFDKIRELFKEQNVIFLSLISFIYGFIHAAGPGHFKLLTATYFASGNTGKALNFAIKMGFLHMVGAFILVLVMFLFLNGFDPKFSHTASEFSYFISGIIIICIASFLLFKSFKKKKMNWHTSDCNCQVCSSLFTKNNEKLFLTASALIPCPGSILVFVMAFEFGAFKAGLLSALFMGLGMSLVIFIAGFLGKQISYRILTYKDIAQKIGLCIMLILGIYMVFDASWFRVL